MKPRARARTVWVCVFATAWAVVGPAWAASSRAREARIDESLNAASARETPSTHPDTRPHWEEVKRLMKRGAYREALQELEMILSLDPDDGLAQAYRTLCEHRLRGDEAVTRLAPESLADLERSAREEEAAQRRAAAEERTVHRAVEKEQQRWDADVERLRREAIRDGKRRRRREEQTQRQQIESRAQAVEEYRRRVGLPASPSQLAVAQEDESSRPRVPPGAPAAAPPSQTTAHAPDQTPAASDRSHPAPSDTSAVELEPVHVSTAVEPPEPESTEPSDEKKLVSTREPGSVQVVADQMGASPDRQLATASGNVRVEFDDGVLTCDRMALFTDTKDFYAQGNVRFEHGAEIFRGDLIQYNIGTKKGRFLSSTAFIDPWYEHGRVIEQIAEGVLHVKPGYITSCELDPPHYRLQGSESIVFAADRSARSRNVRLIVEHLPVLYFPWMSLSDRRTPFFIIPGKKKPWEQYVLMGYRYELPYGHKGTLRLDWRRTFGWGEGVEHRFENRTLGKALVKVYYNKLPYQRASRELMPKGADGDRYRAMFRHKITVLKDTTVVTDIQKFSDVNFKKDFLFREEYLQENNSDSFVSSVTSTKDYTLNLLARKRMNRFQTVTEAYPDAKLDIRPQQIGDSRAFIESTASAANLQTKNAHSEIDTDALYADFFQQLSYAVNFFHPVLMTPKAGLRQTYYNKDIQGGAERPQGKRDLISGQFNTGVDGSLKLFRIFPSVATNLLGLNINQLRHVISPTVSYGYVHEPTVPNGLLVFPQASGPSNTVTFGLQNKLQTRRRILRTDKKPSGVDLLRVEASVPYTFRGIGNKQGGRLGDWQFDLEASPWPWLRLETDWIVPSHFAPATRDARIQRWNTDLIIVGGRSAPLAKNAPSIQAPAVRGFQPGPQVGIPLLPQGQWYLGYGHRYSQNDKTEGVLQFDWRLSQKWQIGTFHRITYKEVAGGAKRFNNVREWQYTLTRDLHDWIGELVYRVDREYGEELFFTLTLKAYPEMPFAVDRSYHQPKIGSQSSPFSPLAQH